MAHGIKNLVHSNDVMGPEVHYSTKLMGTLECLKGYSEHIEYSPWDWNQTRIKLETKYVIYRKLANVL